MDNSGMLKKWLQERCSASSSRLYLGELEAADFPETGRGLLTKREIQAGELIISIPEEAIITPQLAHNSSTLLQSQMDLEAAELLTLFLLQEHSKPRKSSAWSTYIQTIPKTFNTPAFFTPEELSALPTQLRMAARDQRKNIKKCFIKLSKVCGGRLHFDFALFLWAWHAVNTRCVYFSAGRHKSAVSGSCAALVPFLDLFNHSQEVSVKAGFNESKRSYEIHSETRYLRNSQVFICYGPHDNATLLLEYGFILPTNKHDVVTFCLDELMETTRKVSSAKVDDEKLAEIRHLIIQQNWDSHLCGTDLGISWALLQSLRMLAFLQESPVNIVQKTWHLPSACQPHEFGVRRLAGELFASKLQLCDTSLVEDEKLLKESNEKITWNKRMALLLRISQKKIINICLESIKI